MGKSINVSCLLKINLSVPAKLYTTHDNNFILTLFMVIDISLNTTEIKYFLCYLLISVFFCSELASLWLLPVLLPLDCQLSKTGDAEKHKKGLKMYFFSQGLLNSFIFSLSIVEPVVLKQ